MMRQSIVAVGLIVVAAVPAQMRAQDSMARIEIPQVKRSGPRYGVIWLSPQLTDSISAKNKHQKINPTTSLFGWEFQTELLQNPRGAVPIASIVLGVAGLDQGLVLPSATWLVGMRSRDDFELGIGPNVSLAGAALAITGGMTFHSGALNIPVDVAYVSSKLGTRISLTTGFNIMK
jgi:hypothetical protein